MKLYLLAGALVLTACSVPAATSGPSTSPAGRPLPAVAVPAAATPSVAVLGVKLARPTSLPKPTAHEKPTVHRAAGPRPSTVKQKQAAGTCVVGKPCSIAGVKWTKTVGCTREWLAAQRRTNPDAQCPPGWPPIP